MLYQSTRNHELKATSAQAVLNGLAPDGGLYTLPQMNDFSFDWRGCLQLSTQGMATEILSALLDDFSREEMEQRKDEIIAFADIGEYIHQPVKNYSSGMFARLAFAVAINVEPDILIVDEALSVGDVLFRRKSFQKMKELISKEDRTVIIVSHNNQTVSNLCDEVLWLNDGELVEYGPTKEVLPRYIEFMK